MAKNPTAPNAQDKKDKIFHLYDNIIAIKLMANTYYYDNAAYKKAPKQ